VRAHAFALVISKRLGQFVVDLRSRDGFGRWSSARSREQPPATGVRTLDCVEAPGYPTLSRVSVTLVGL
jgi:hypothetical protein